MVRDDGERALLYELDMGIIEARKSLPVDHPAVVSLTHSYHNLLRRWADV
jgi:PKHD-type hydroxylase